jgi:uncharacterized sulfatase
MFQTPTTIAWKRAFEEGKLNEVQSFFWKPKPTEELYDLSKDPYQTVNLASEEDHQSTLETMRNRLRDWTISTRDLGLMHESVFHRLSTGKAPRELGLDTNAYPLEEIFETADLAVRRAQAQEELEPLLSHADSRIRYWGLQGSLTLAVRGTPVSMTSVIPLLQDEDLANGALAGEIVGRFGSSEQRQQAIERLLEIASAKPGDFFARLQALLALDFVEANANELNSSLDAISPSAGALPGRYSPYVERTIVRLKSKNSGS